jgi:hypothetical protein
MNCQNCGRAITLDATTVADTRSVPIGVAGDDGQKTELRAIVLCPECARSRRNLFRFLILTIVAAIAALAIWKAFFV